MYCACDAITDQLQVLSEIGSGTHGRVRLGQDMTAEIPAADDDGELHPPTCPENSFYVGTGINSIALTDQISRLSKLSIGIPKENVLLVSVDTKDRREGLSC